MSGTRKATANWRKHGIDFESATRALRDPLAVEQLDLREDYGEDRINIVGMCEDTLLHITCVEHGDTFRVISGRRANNNKDEQADYYRKGGP